MDSLSATESYFSLYNSMSSVSPATLLSLFFLTLARIIPIVALAPFFGTKNVPVTIRMMFGLALAAIFLPVNLMMVKENISFDSLFIAYFIKELLIGFALGFMAGAPFLIAQMAGSLIDHQRGSSALQVMDPTTQTQTGPIGMLYNFVLIAIFFSMNGPFLFLDGVANSYQLIPANGLISPTFFGPNVNFWKQIIGFHQFAMNLCLQLSAPALIGILLTDMFLGIANRLAPQVQIVFLGISLKSWVGIALLAAAWTLVLRVMGQEAISWFKGLNQLIQQVGTLYSIK